MNKKRKSYTPEFKLKVVLESMQRDTTQEEACQRFGVSSSMLHRWRTELGSNKSAPLFCALETHQALSFAGL
jgi:transposase